MSVKSLCIILGISISCAFHNASAAEKKIIGHSWDLLGVRPADVARNLDQWEKLPLDGISLAVMKKSDMGEEIGFKTIMNDHRWKRDWFQSEIPVVKQCASRNLKHNFLASYWAPRKRLAWTDDEEWNRFAHNLGVLAWLAREGKAKGVLIDPEDYPATRQYFHVEGDPSFSATAMAARRRGAQVMSAMADQYPDITIFSFWVLSMNPGYLLHADPHQAVAAAGDLWPAFVNGMLDALPSGARIVDGNEHGYRYKAANNDFYLSVYRMQNKALGLVEPENHMKYRNQVLAGFGLYLDMYTNPPDSPWYFGEVNGSRLNNLRLNFEQALDAAQEYVWVYGEKMDWITWRGAGRKANSTWEDRLPGFNSTLAFLKDKEEWVKTELKRRKKMGTLTNLVSIASFEKKVTAVDNGFKKGWLPPKWWFWQNEKLRQGQFGVDVGNGDEDNVSLCAAGVQNGCFGTSIPTSPGCCYALKLSAKGAVSPVYVGWKRKGQWDWTIPRIAVYFRKGSEGGWQSAFRVFKVPENVDELVLSLSAIQDADQRTWFDNVALYPITF